jgi:hypothetical protein
LNKKTFLLIIFILVLRQIKQINMKKETRGRKALPEKEKKKPVYIMVQSKFIKEVKPKLKAIEREYSTKQSHPAL